MKTLREQIAGRCRHFTGTQNKACERRAFPTDAEIAEIDRSFKAMCEARAAIVATKKDAGTVACPKCGTADALRFRVASCNGHVHAACATVGCLAWME